ncbi:MAG: polyprenyl synthetase family protein [Anaerohalosphaeraceae bacterium]
MPTPEPLSDSAFRSIEQLVQAELQSVQIRIRQALSTDNPLLASRLDTLAEKPGKMLRPLLLLLSAKACGRIYPEHIDLAAMIELIHTATLLHDDVVDRAALRRGRPSANILWGNTAAVLLGDLLLSRALGLGARLHQPALTEQIVKTAQDICEGELLQNIHRGNWRMSKDLYRQIITGKTAALFALSCRLGAQWAQAEEAAVQALCEYGLYFGQAFQIRDDAADLFSTESKTGKTLGTDLREGKPTLAVILWLETFSEDEKRQAVEHLENPRKHSAVLRQIKKSSVPFQIHQELAALTEQACRALQPLADSAAKKALFQLAEETAKTP